MSIEYKEVERITGVGYEYIKEKDGDLVWYLNGEQHREEGPSYKSTNGYEHWVLNGKCHRPNGPAIKYSDGFEEWWLEGAKLELEQVEKMKHLLTCDLNELPLYMNTEFRSVVEWRLKQNA